MTDAEIAAQLRKLMAAYPLGTMDWPLDVMTNAATALECRRASSSLGGIEGGVQREDALTAGALTAEKADVIEALIDALNAAAGCNDLSGVTDDLLFSHARNQLQSVEIICRDAIEAYEKSTGGDTRGEATAPPSSARERRMADALREINAAIKKHGTMVAGMYVFDAIGEVRKILHALAVSLHNDRAALSSDGRGREKGNTSNSEDGIDPTPPATESTKP